MNGHCWSCHEEDIEVRGFRIDDEITELLCEECCDYLDYAGAHLEGDYAAWDFLDNEEG